MSSTALTPARHPPSLAAHPLMAIVTVCLWMVVGMRRLVRGPRHPQWSFRYELTAEILRRMTQRSRRLTPQQTRRLTPDAPVLPDVRRSTDFTRITWAGMPTEVHTPKGWDPDTGATILYFHGGGYVVCSPGSHRDMIARLAHVTQARCLAPDYRMAPEHPFPAPIEDGQRAYRQILKEVPPERLIVAGDSAGGNMTLEVALGAIKEGLPNAAALVLLSPWVDLTLSGQSIQEHARWCYLDHDTLTIYSQHYLQGADPNTPQASPLQADLKGLPPTMLLTGDAEAFHSEDLALAKRLEDAGVETKLLVGPGMIHVWPVFSWALKEGRKAIHQIGDFVQDTLERSNPTQHP